MASTSDASGFKSIDDAPGQHFLLFLPWIQQELQKEKIHQFYEDFGMTKGQRDGLLEAYTLQDNDEQYQNIFSAYLELFKDDKIAHAIGKWWFQNSKQEQAQWLLMDKADPAAFEVYVSEILNHPRRLCLNSQLSGCFPVKEVVTALKRSNTDAVYRKIADEVNTLLEQDRLLALWKAKCLMVLRFILTKPERREARNWLLELIFACSHHPKSRALALFVYPDYKDKIEEYKVIVETQNAPLPQFTVDLVSDQPPTSIRPPSMFGKPPQRVTGEISPTTYTLFGYQEELAGPAKNGKNTIICAPTGSGKTIIAIDIISQHLRNKKMKKEVGRAVMFVPTIPLVTQQSNNFDEKVGTEFYVTKMSGDERTKVANESLVDILQGDIVVMTPQIFINMLKSPLKSQRIYLTDFTMLIFDECHHCTADHPYNVLMGEVRNSSYKPQVVGLTASVGSGKPKQGIINAHDTLEHIYGLCARLTASTVSSVKDKKNIEELLERVPQPIDEFYSVDSPDVDYFAHELALICDAIEDAMIPELRTMLSLFPAIKSETLNLAKERDMKHKNGHSKTTGRYYHHITLFRVEIERKVDAMKNTRLFVLKCLNLLNILYYTMKYNELFPASLAVNYLDIRLKEFEEHDLFLENDHKTDLSIEKLERLRSLFFQTIKGNLNERVLPHQRASENKPILDELKKVIIKQHEHNPESRILIFVSMRRVGNDLAQYLNQCEAVRSTFGPNKVGYIASTNQASARFGQTPKEQAERLEQFHRGILNILVATSVAEEGLDVTACNLIIKYNSVGSEKSLTQRKGRARAKNSKAILLALSDDIMSREYENVRKEYLMNLCVRELQMMSERSLHHQIAEKENEMKIKEEEAKRREIQRHNLHTQRYELCCIECNEYICDSDELFTLNNNEVICCNTFCWNNSRIERKIKANLNRPTICGEWRCRCGRVRGTVIKYGGVFLPSLNHNCFNLRNVDNGANEEKSTWEWIKTNKFNIPCITSDEIRKMASSLFEYDQTIFKKAEECEHLNILEAVKERDKKTFRANYALRD